MAGESFISFAPSDMVRVAIDRATRYAWQRGVTVVASTDVGRFCRKVRWSMVMRVAGLTLDQRTLVHVHALDLRPSHERSHRPTRMVRRRRTSTRSNRSGST